MVGSVGIKDYGTIAGTIAATSALQAAMAQTNATTQAVGNAIVPPGTEGASVLARTKQVSNTNDFATKLGLGIVELDKRNAIMAKHSAETAAIDAAGAGSISSVPAAF